MMEFSFKNGELAVRADCNVCPGTYVLSGEFLKVGRLACTLAYCGSASLDTSRSRKDSRSRRDSGGAAIDRRGDMLAALERNRVVKLAGSSGSRLWSGPRVQRATFDRNGDVVTVQDRGEGVVKLRGADGKEIWTERLGGRGALINANLTADGAGDIFLAAGFEGEINIGGVSLLSAGGTDVMVAKLSGADGSVVWAKRFGGTDDDRVWSIASSDAVFFTGSFRGTIEFGGEPLIETDLGRDGRDIFVAKLGGSDGRHLYSTHFAGRTNVRNDGLRDEGLGVAVDGTGNAFLAGRYGGEIDIGGIRVGPGVGGGRALDRLFVTRLDR